MDGRADAAARGGWRLLLCLPLAALCIAVLAISASGVAALTLPGVLAWAQRDVPLAAAATFACFLLAAPAAAARPGIAWLLPLLVVSAAGGLGWSGLPLPAGPVNDATRAVVLTSPVMVLMLAAAWARLPAGMLRTAAAAGAPPATRVALWLRLALPGALGACAMVGVLCLSLITARPAAP